MNLDFKKMQEDLEEEFDREQIHGFAVEMNESWKNNQEYVLKPQLVEGELMNCCIPSAKLMALFNLNGSNYITINQFLNEYYPHAQKIAHETHRIPNIVSYATERGYKIDFGNELMRSSKRPTL